jgi:hypothetical protein
MRFDRVALEVRSALVPRRFLMRSVTYAMSVSRDGYIVGPDGGFD